MTIEDLEKKIYHLDKEKDLVEKRIDNSVKEEPILIENKENNQLSKESVEPVLKPSKKRSKLFIGLIIFCIFVVFGGALYFLIFLKQAPVDNFEVKFEFPKNIYVGAPFDFNVILNNISNIEAKDVKLILLLPDDVLAYNKSSELKQNLGNIKPKEIISKSFSILVLNEDIKTAKKIKVILDYSLGGRQRFQFIKEDSFFVFEEPVKIEVQKPDYIFFEQDFDVYITFNNLTSFYYENLPLEFVFPKNFELISYENFKAVNGSKTNFILDAVRPLEQKTIKFKGKIKKDKEEPLENLNLNFGLILKNNFNEQKDSLVLAKNSFYLEVLKDVVDIDLMVNKSKNYLIKNSEKLDFNIIFKNNSPKSIFDIVLKVKFLDDFFDFDSLKTDGYFEKQNKTLVWQPNINFNLKKVAPKEAKELNFSLILKDLTNFNLKNPKISLEVTLESPTIINQKTDKTFSKKIFDFRIKNEVAFTEEIFYQDPAGYINSGELPLKADKKTQFTVYWLIKNKFNDLEKINIKTSLAYNVDFVKVVSFNSKSQPVYNSRTKELILKLDKIEAGSGYSKEPVKIGFQIEALPDKYMVNKFMPLLKEVSFEAVDVLTKEKINIKLPTLTSEKISGVDAEMLKVVE